MFYIKFYDVSAMIFSDFITLANTYPTFLFQVCQFSAAFFPPQPSWDYPVTEGQQTW
jgi:hypothetical protein